MLLLLLLQQTELTITLELKHYDHAVLHDCILRHSAKDVVKENS